jgi:hypothetical protein
MEFPRRISGLACLVGLLLACGLATGCATGRGTIDLKPADTANPATGPEIRLVRVSDRRVFQVDPPSPWIPSVMNDEIENTAITSRAIARKRGGFGMALGDIVLPEGRTVVQVTREALSRGLRESGYRVLEEGDPGYDAAIPLQADIQQFWAWVSPGMWTLTLEFDSRIRVSGPIQHFDDGEEFRGHAITNPSAAFTDDWIDVMNKGLENLNDDIKSRHLLSVTSPPRDSIALGTYASESH